jgi:hypothetical protein
MFALALCIGSTLALWLWYAAFTLLLRSRRPAARSAGQYVRLCGLPLDILYNWLVGSILFLEAPEELTFSRRLKRHIGAVWRGRIGWRYVLALTICRVFIWSVDPDHLDGEFL